MSLFGAKKRRAVTPDYTGLQTQTASSALPVAIVYGTNRAAPNLIWHDGFQTHAQRSKAAGGKGGGQKATVTGTTYSTWLMLGVGEGPIQGIGTIWNGQASAAYPAYGLSLIPGTTPQDPWAPAAVRYPDAALAYPGTAYAASPAFDLGSSAGIPQLAFEVRGRLVGSPSSADDADPAAMLVDFLTNAQYGTGFPAASLDARTILGSPGDGSYQTYCAALGLSLSPVLADQETASSILTRWLLLTNAAPVWSGGLLKIVPYGDLPVTGTTLAGGTVTFQPNVAPVYDLTDDDVLHAEDEDPVRLTRSDPHGIPNLQRIECSDRGHAYAATTVEARDQAAIERFGLKAGASVTAREICALPVAGLVAQLLLQRTLYIRNTYTFRLSWEYCLLEPMDVVTLTDPGLGLARTPVRIREIEEDEAGLLTVVAEEFPGGVATASLYPVAGSAGRSINRDVAAAPVNPPVIVEPPPDLTGGRAEVWIAASGGSGGVADPNWGGANVWISRDGVSYAEIGTLTAPARHGVLTAPLPAPAGPNPDTASTLAVDLSRSGGALAGASLADAQNAVTLALVDHELVAYAGATLTGPNAYALTTLMRGLYGSAPATHAAGAAFTRLDEAVFRYALPAPYVGVPLSLKLQSFNVFGGAVQDLATCVAYPYTPVGSGRMGSVSEALAAGNPVDLGLASQVAAQADDFGLASDPYPTVIDLGLASS
ncbi:phage tail protein [Methylobacterium currus]|uniref:phage tail protein n=1 Tax=Methylobacterium currus TaxID=2051553 RepID=UPI001E318F5E|nr:phage tail protein [Methylobacterium currus]UHC16074.1 phage tail protein [Methylobacterium currus]